jgi:hypothetical protein
MKVRDDNIKIDVKVNSVRRYKQDRIQFPEGPMADTFICIRIPLRAARFFVT